MNKEKLKKELIPLYEELIKFANTEKHCAFCMQWGKNFPEKNGVLFVGKAVNGWVTKEFTIDSIFHSDDAERVFDRPDQMEWVEEYWHEPNPDGWRASSSAFWRVINGITLKLYPKETEINSGDWWKYIAWSNLYKLAPQSGGNPPIRGGQLEACKKILQKEIEILSPKFVVLLTSWEWAKDFIESLKNYNKDDFQTFEWDNYAAWLYQINGINYIVSEHPQGKPQEIHIDTIVEIIKSLTN